MTFVDEIGLERKPRKLGAANADVVLRFCLSFRTASRSKSRSTRVLPVLAPVRVREKTIFRPSARPVRSRGVRVDSLPPAHPSRPSSHRVAAHRDGFRSGATTQ